MMQIDCKDNKDKIAIVVVGFNRVIPLKRLLNALESAEYDGVDTPLVISIDCSNNQDVYNIANNFQWGHGDKYVFIQDKRLGLKEHIIKCGDLTRFFKAIVLFEEDIFPSPYFYSFVKEAVDYYELDKTVAGIALYKNYYNGYKGIPQYFMNNGSDVFLWQEVCTWGQCWTSTMWDEFKCWYIKNTEFDFTTIDIPEEIVSWKAAWSKYYLAYMICNNKYFLYPQVSLSTNFSEAGTHVSSRSNSCQVNLLNGRKTFYFDNTANLPTYDIYGYNNNLTNCFSQYSEITIDFWLLRSHRFRKRYLLSCESLDFKVVQSFDFCLKPIELNIYYGLKGQGIYLYDTQQKDNSHVPSMIYDYFFQFISFQYIKEGFLRRKKKLQVFLIKAVSKFL